MEHTDAIHQNCSEQYGRSLYEQCIYNAFTMQLVASLIGIVAYSRT